MRDDQRGPDPKAGSPDRKTRVKGDRVIHTVAGKVYKGDRYTRPWGLTTEQNERQRVGEKIDERQVREAARGERDTTQFGHLGEQGKEPIEHTRGTDDIAVPPYGKRGDDQGKE